MGIGCFLLLTFGAITAYELSCFVIVLVCIYTTTTVSELMGTLM